MEEDRAEEASNKIREFIETNANVEDVLGMIAEDIISYCDGGEEKYFNGKILKSIQDIKKVLDKLIQCESVEKSPLHDNLVEDIKTSFEQIKNNRSKEKMPKDLEKACKLLTKMCDSIENYWDDKSMLSLNKCKVADENASIVIELLKLFCDNDLCGEDDKEALKYMISLQSKIREELTEIREKLKKAESQKARTAENVGSSKYVKGADTNNEKTKLKDQDISNEDDNLVGLKQDIVQLRAQLLKSDDPKLPENFEIGQAITNGSCFFDSFRQGLEERLGLKVSVNQLRQYCKEFAQNNPPEWFINAIYNSRNKDGVVLRETPDLYIKNILYNSRWGDSNIEGRILCQKYNVKLHAIEKHTIDGIITWADQIVDAAGSSSVDNVNYNENNVIHMVNRGRDHFEPVLSVQGIQRSKQHLSENRFQIKESQPESKIQDFELIGSVAGNCASTLTQQRKDFESFQAESFSCVNALSCVTGNICANKPASGLYDVSVRNISQARSVGS